MAAKFGSVNLKGHISIAIEGVLENTEVGTFEFPIDLIQRTESDGVIHLGPTIDQAKVNHRIELIADGIRAALEAE